MMGRVGEKAIFLLQNNIRYANKENHLFDNNILSTAVNHKTTRKARCTWQY